MKHYTKNKIINKGKFFQATMTILLKSHLALAEPDCHLKISGLVAIKHETLRRDPRRRMDGMHDSRKHKCMASTTPNDNPNAHVYRRKTYQLE
jgi:hypothetical protein